MADEPSLTALLQERANRQPDAAAYTFIDYEADPNGISETLTWGQVHQRAQVVADSRPFARCPHRGRDGRHLTLRRQLERGVIMTSNIQRSDGAASGRRLQKGSLPSPKNCRGQSGRIHAATAFSV